MTDLSGDKGSDADQKFSGKLLLAVVLSSTVAAIAWLLAFATGRIEIGVPGEWVWSPHKIEAAVDVAIPIGVALLSCGAYLAIVRCLAKHLYLKPRRSVFILPIMVVLGFFALWSIQSCAPSPHRLIKPNGVLYYRGVSGYFAEARQLESLDDYLASYEAEMAKGDVLHKGTHPPGLVLVNVGLLELCRENRSLANWILWTMPNSVSDTFTQLVPKTKLPEPDRAALWLSVLLTQAVAALAVVPLYFLLRRELNAESSLLFASLWPLVPGLSVFLPKSDALYPFLGGVFLWFGISAWEKGSIGRAIVAGLVFWFGMMLSLAMLPFAALAGVHCLLRLKTSAPGWAGLGRFSGGLAAGFGAATIGFYAATGIRLWKTWLMNFHNHSGFYDQYERTYSKWLAANPLELLLTVGAPVLALAVIGATLCFRKGARAQCVTPVAVLFVWTLLWLSGKNMGEAARLWLLLTPAFVWAAGSVFARMKSRETIRWWLVTAVCQLIVCILTVTVTNGFSF